MLDFIKAPININNCSKDEIIRIRYQPTGIGLGDCCFASDESGFHCFYITRKRELAADCSAPGQETAIGHGVGKDIFSMKETTVAVHCTEGACMGAVCGLSR